MRQCDIRGMRDTGQRKQRKNPETDQHKYTQLIFDKGVKNFNRRIPFLKMVLEQWKKKTLQPEPCIRYKNKLKNETWT